MCVCVGGGGGFQFKQQQKYTPWIQITGKSLVEYEQWQWI